MPLGRWGKADCLAGQTLDPGPQRQMLALDLLRVPLAWMVLVGAEMTGRGPPIIRVIACDPQGLSQGLQLQKRLVLTRTQDVRQDLPRAVINRMPQPSLRFLLPHAGPHLIAFRFVRTADNHVHVARVQRIEQGVVDGGECRPFCFNSFMTVVGLIRNTRAVSRMPLPLRLLSTTCSLISGNRPLCVR